MTVSKGNRLVNWIVYNLIFGLIPLLSVWFFRALVDRNIFDISSDFQEVLFFALMLCATTLSDVRTERKSEQWNIAFLLMDAALIISVVTIAVIYGGLRYAHIINPAATYHTQILNGIIYFTIVVFVISVLCQIILTITQSSTRKRSKLNDKGGNK